MMGNIKKIASIAMSAVFAVSLLSGTGIVSEAKDKENNTVGNPYRTAIEDEDEGIDYCNVTWNSVYFGNYPQSDITGKIKDPIRWQVLSVDENNVAMLLADQNLDVYPYNNKIAEIDWEACSLRQWLNTDFLGEAFSDEEQEALVLNDKDKVSLLTDSQALNLKYGFYPSTHKDELRIKKNSAYAAAGGSSDYTQVNAVGQPNAWWLKTGGYYKDDAVFISDEGAVRADGIVVGYGGNAVCPVVLVDMNKANESGVITIADNISKQEDAKYSRGYTYDENNWKWYWQFNFGGDISIIPRVSQNYSGFVNEIEIPEKISDHGNDYVVNEIEACSFDPSYNMQGEELQWVDTYIYIPNTVNKIAPNIFDAHKDLITICGKEGSYAEEYANANDIAFAPGESIKEARFNAIKSNIVVSDKVLNIAVWNDEFARRLEEYYPRYIPNDEDDATKGGKIGDTEVKFIVVPSDGNDYQNFLDTCIDKIDMFMVESDYALKYIDTDNTLPISELGITDDELSDQYEYTKDIGKDINGVLKGVTWQVCPGVMFYNREAAETVLGSDDPVVVQGYVSNWDKYNDTADLVHEAGYKMTATTNDTYRVFSDNVSVPWTTTDVTNVTIDANIEKWAKMMKEQVDNGITETGDLWGSTWSKGFYPEGKVFCYFGPAWLADFCMAADDSTSIANKGGWAACEGPAGFSWGGTWLCAGKNTDNKELIADIIRKLTIDDNIMTSIAKETDDQVNNISVMDSLANDSSLGDSVLGGQNALGVYSANAKKLHLNYRTWYDNQCSEQFQSAMNDYFDGYPDTYEDAVTLFRKRMLGLDEDTVAKKIKTTDSTIVMKVGDWEHIDITLIPRNSVSEPIWKSSNPKVATVDSYGGVTAQATGKTTITYKDKKSGLTATFVVKVKDTGVVNSKYNATIEKSKYTLDFSDCDWGNPQLIVINISPMLEGTENNRYYNYDYENKKGYKWNYDISNFNAGLSCSSVYFENDIDSNTTKLVLMVYPYYSEWRGDANVGYDTLNVWITVDESDERIVDVDIPIEITDKNNTLEKWNHTYTVTYDANGGYMSWCQDSEGNITTYNQYNTCKVPVGDAIKYSHFPPQSKENKKFLGWRTEGDNTLYKEEQYDLKNGEKYIGDYVPTGDVTFVACWEGDDTSSGSKNDDGNNTPTTVQPVTNPIEDNDTKEDGTKPGNDNSNKENVTGQSSSQQNTNDTVQSGADTSTITSDKQLEVGNVVEKDDIQYIITENSEGNVEVSYQAPENTKATSYVVPDTVTLSDGTVAQVTAVAPNAFKKCKKLKKVVLGKNIEKVGKNAFNGCKNLKTITIKSTKLTKKSFGKNAFKGISKKATITVPKKQYKNYKKWLKATGLSKGVKIKKK